MSDLLKFIGIPFVNGGRDYSGCDCLGLVILVYRDLFGAPFPDYKIDCDASGQIGAALMADLPRLCRRVDPPTAPAIVVMETDHALPGVFNHMGVHVGGGRFLHTIRKQNSHLDRVDHPYWARCIRGFYALVG